MGIVPDPDSDLDPTHRQPEAPSAFTSQAEASLASDGTPRRIAVLAGGVGGARYLLGVRELARRTGVQVTAIVNTGDDATMHGLRVCPDLDSVMYTLGGSHDPVRGWGQLDETWTVGEELRAYGVGPTWFALGDKDIATHLVRTQLLGAGYPLSDVTTALMTRWQPGITVLPMSDERVETHVIADLPATEDQPAGRRAIHFQEWWARYRAGVPTHGFVQVGVEQAQPAPGVADAIIAADLVLIAPSNPVVSIGTILGVTGIREALGRCAGRIVGTSPIVSGAALRGMADICLRTIGVPTTAAGVGAHYGARRDGGLLDGWLVAPGDGADISGVEVREIPLLMTDPTTTAAMVQDAVDLAAELQPVLTTCADDE